jgi:hypothetical protein
MRSFTSEEFMNAYNSGRRDFSNMDLSDLTLRQQRINIICKFISADAKRTSSLVGRKCRAFIATPLEFYDENRNILKDVDFAYSWWDQKFRYNKNNPTMADGWNDDVRIECTNGIHFFMTFDEAVEY